MNSNKTRLINNYRSLNRLLQFLSMIPPFFLCLSTVIPARLLGPLISVEPIRRTFPQRYWAFTSYIQITGIYELVATPWDWADWI